MLSPSEKKEIITPISNKDNASICSAHQLPAFISLPGFRESTFQVQAKSEDKPTIEIPNRNRSNSLFIPQLNQGGHSEGLLVNRSTTAAEKRLQSTLPRISSVTTFLQTFRKNPLHDIGKDSLESRKQESNVIESTNFQETANDLSSAMSIDARVLRMKTSNTSEGSSKLSLTEIRVLSRVKSNDDELNCHELKLLQCAAQGDLENLKCVFQERDYYLFILDVNCVDSLDRTALSLATMNNHLDVIKFLLSDEIQGINLGDALFYAIQCEFIEAIELLLQKDPQTSLQVLPGTTSPFEPGLTPFMLAAHRNNYKILLLLYRYSHSLTFNTDKVILDDGFDPFSWDAVMKRLLHFRARASPAFMLLMYNEKGLSGDPLNAAMDLFGELHVLATREREVDESYLKMAEQCEKFANELLQEIKSAHELADLMRYNLEEDEDEEMEIIKENDETQIATKQRQHIKHYLKPIEKAVKYEMKDFVTSDNSQLALIYIQKGRLFRRLKGTKAVMFQIFLGILFPFLSLAYLFAPKSTIGRLMLNPTVKFWCWLSSEIVFVIILLMNTIFLEYGMFEEHDVISPLLIVAYFWIIGKFMQEIREIKNQGLKEYLSDIWNWNDMFTILLYTFYICLRMFYVISEGSLKRTKKGDVYWYYTMWDPLPLSDICIAIAYILIHMRIMELLRAERRFGPLQVSLDLMLKDAIRFSIVFCIIFLAFGSGIAELYAPYDTKKNCSCNATYTCNQRLPLIQKWDASYNTTILGRPACMACKSDTEKSQEVTELGTTLMGLFWSLFGYGTPGEWYHTGNCMGQFQIQNMVGTAIMGLYHFAAIIVFVNMLIAMMSNSFQKTHDDSEREWKFHRTQLWLKFIRNEMNRPPPLNIIPRWKDIKAIFRCFHGKLKQQLDIDEFNGQCRESYVDDTGGTLVDGSSKYAQVLRLVVLRYVKQKVLRGEMVI